ncbi:MAG: hypothetical protein WD512_10720, partial [Candidatus Paceibacterota bacterium]
TNELIVSYRDNNDCKHTERISDILKLEVLYKICKNNESNIVNLLVLMAGGSVSYTDLDFFIKTISAQFIKIRELNNIKHRSVAENNKLCRLSYNMGQTTKNARIKLYMF